MRSPYNLESVDSCRDCEMRLEGFFCNLPPEALQSFEAIKCTSIYPKGVMLFAEGQEPRGIYLLCKGRVKLSISSSEGKMLILRIAAPGEVIGLGATISEQPYELTAETLETCQINFVRREDFLHLLKTHHAACFNVARHLSRIYHSAHAQIRALGLTHSAREKLANLLLECSEMSGRETEQGIYLKLGLTHEEMARMIGTSRETVSRLLSEFKSKRFIHQKGASLLIRNKAALESMIRI